MSYICRPSIWVKIAYILLFVLYVGLFLSSPLSFFCLHLFCSICGSVFRLPGGPPYTYVPSVQQQQQHHFLQWKICFSSVLQSTR